MKRISLLSLLLFIAGNGLMVNQALPITLDRTNQQMIGFFCFTGGLACLTNTLLETLTPASSLRALNQQLNQQRNTEASSSATDKPALAPDIQQTQNAIKSIRLLIPTVLIAGIPLTALGAYLYFKK